MTNEIIEILQILSLPEDEREKLLQTVTENAPKPKRPWMEKIKDAARISGLPEHMIRNKVLSGELVAISSGRRYLVNMDKLFEYLNSNKLEKTAEQVLASGITAIPVKL